jgi:hypothetical protein
MGCQVGSSPCCFRGGRSTWAYKPQLLASTSHAYQVYSGTFVLGILWHSLHQAFASSAWACPQSTSPVAFRTFAGVCFAGFTAVRPLEGRKGRPYSVHPLLEFQDRFFCIRSPACTCFSLHCTLPELPHSRRSACAHKGPLECLHSLPDMFILLCFASGGRGVRLPVSCSQRYAACHSHMHSRVLHVSAALCCKFRLHFGCLLTTNASPLDVGPDNLSTGPVRALCHEDVWPTGLAGLSLQYISPVFKSKVTGSTSMTMWSRFHCMQASRLTLHWVAMSL